MTRLTQEPTNALRAVTLCLDPGSLNILQRHVASLKGVELVGDIRQYAGHAGDGNQLAGLLPDVVMVDFDLDREQAAAAAEHLESMLQGRAAIFAVSSKSEPDLIIRAMQSGCSEYLVKPLARDRIEQAFAKVEARKREREKSQKSGKIITLLGAKGGAGVTTIAVHLSTFLARLSTHKTLLIDQHPNLGDAALYLGIDKHLYNFYELISNIQRLDANLVQGFVAHHSSGLDVLASADTFDSTLGAAANDVEFVLDFLKTIYDYTIIDCSPGLSGLNLAAVQKSDEVWLVATPDVPSVRNLSRYLEHLTRFSFPVDAVRIIINRHSKRDAITKEHVERVLRRPVYMTLPNNYAEVMAAVNTGMPMSPQAKTEFAIVLKHWAESLFGHAAPTARGEVKRPWAVLGL
ncbi:MAG: AAA family ATPase [Candidatus Angelobacter sp.]